MDIMLMGKNPNFLGSWDLYDLPNNKIQVTIAKIVDEEIVNQGKKENATVCHFKEKYKPMILNLTNKKTLSKLFKTIDTDKLIGKRIEIGYENIKAFGKVHDALRISNRLISQTTEVKIVKCEICNNDIQPMSRMTSEQVAEYTKNKYGQALCSVCATKKAQEVNNNVAN